MNGDKNSSNILVFGWRYVSHASQLSISVNTIENSINHTWPTPLKLLYIYIIHILSLKLKLSNRETQRHCDCFFYCESWQVGGSLRCFLVLSLLLLQLLCFLEVNDASAFFDSLFVVIFYVLWIKIEFSFVMIES